MLTLLLHHSKHSWRRRRCCTTFYYSSTSNILLQPSSCNKAIIPSNKRTFAAVREVSWCAQSDSPNNNRKLRTSLSLSIQQSSNKDDNNDNNNNSDQSSSSLIPIDSFGIVAAMSKKNRVIGVSGRLPWKAEEMIQDRIAFEALTRNKILIIGRKTLLERQESEQQQQQQASSNDDDTTRTTDVLSHVSHAKTVIVLSKTAKHIDNLINVPAASLDKTSLVLARSFPEALHVARELVESSNQAHSSARSTNDINYEAKGAEGEDGDDDDNIQCWVAGGEGIYNEALLHPSAKVIHLTVVDKDIVLVNNTTSTKTTIASNTGKNDIPDSSTIITARFPAKYRWDHKYRLHRQEEYNISSTSSTEQQLPFTRFVYHRIKNKDNKYL